MFNIILSERCHIISITKPKLFEQKNQSSGFNPGLEPRVRLQKVLLRFQVNEQVLLCLNRFTAPHYATPFPTNRVFNQHF